MANIVLKKTISELMEMQKYYQADLLDKNPPGSLFTAKRKTCSITAYKSGKVLFQGIDCEAEAKKWDRAIHSSKASAAIQKKKAAGLPEGFSSLSVIGSDEVGTGDYFGPITVVAAYVEKDQIPLLKELGVRDSKDLNDEKISAIAKKIKDILPYSLLTLHNEKYNQLQQAGMSQGKIKALLHNQAISHVLKKIVPVKPEAILIDQFVQPDTYFQHLRNEKTIIKDDVFFSTKAEGIHVAVAAASILARYAFVQYFDRLSDVAGMKIPKGAGAQVDEAAARLILAKGSEVLPKFVKLHFANTEKAMKLVRKKRG
ncbi:ribonuclease HIII [Neobacillus sp. SM06]|uniref:ribonuclease HIII n=1 Tax=Neobacillus sp. SM06 TaxID=3422492 RepID=UPI003D2D6512